MLADDSGGNNLLRLLDEEQRSSSTLHRNLSRCEAKLKRKNLDEPAFKALRIVYETSHDERSEIRNGS
ncbi:hypothetical protein JTE90_007733 [Oedothorax gibbosus]|uniref:Uncharacterized protein n=1 Tax=Oedothorax gibbosus TaxID=931172 RepID=A0AAV6V5N1_9ARAC|nr:hypothetical protein JTE90_007733 [Oedothorax gibbosus]